MDPFFGALPSRPDDGGVDVGAAGRFASDDEVVVPRNVLEKEPVVGEGLPFELEPRDGFLEADEDDFSARGRGAEVDEDGRDDPAYPVDGRRGALEAESLGADVVLLALCGKSLSPSSLAFLLAVEPFDGLGGGAAADVVGLSPVMEASSWLIWDRGDHGN